MTTKTSPRLRPSTQAPLLPLENGDRLPRAEFLRRAEAMTGVAKIERIEGVVYMQAAVRFTQHGGPNSHLVGWLVVYLAETPGVETATDTTLQLDDDNDPQPDAFLRIAPQRGGQSGTTDDGYASGPAEFVAEVAASSVSLDLHQKLEVYRRNGVQEYLVWKIAEREIVWFRLRDGRYEPLPADERGIIRSEVFPGLWLDAPAMLRGEMAQVLRVLYEGIASPEHREFAASLADQ